MLEIDRDKIAELCAAKPHLSAVMQRPELRDPKDKGLPLMVEEISPNCYMLCLSSKFDEETMRRLGYDA